MIVVKDLCYEYAGTRALKNVSFKIAKGSITALVGPNGAGKTTLLRCLAALDEPFAGHIEIAGIDIIAEPRRAHQQLGYLSDFFGLYDDLTVKQFLTFSACLHKIPAVNVEAKVDEAARLLELSPWLSHKTQSLSRGWRQRVGIAQAIVHNPSLLLLDEPASGLDPEARLQLSAFFRRLREQGMTLIISSHILAELEDYCTDMLILREGEIIEHQSAAKAKTGPIIQITFAHDVDQFASLVEATQHVTSFTKSGDNIRFRFVADDELQRALFMDLIKAGASIKYLNANAETLQDIYLSIGNTSGASDAHQP